MSEVSVQPLLAQHRDERGQQRHREACVQEVQGRDDLRRGAIPRRRKCGIFTWSDRSIEAEENGSEIGFRPLAGVLLELGLDVDDEGGADRREQTGLGMWSMLRGDKGDTKAYENQGSVEVSVVLLDVFGVVLDRFSFIHGVEVEFGVVVLDWLEEHPEGLLDAKFLQSAYRSLRSILDLKNAPSRVDIDPFRILLTAHRR